MSHFTDNLHLRREIQRLLNENFQLKQILMEADPNAKSAEEREKEMADEIDAQAEAAQKKAEAARQEARDQEIAVNNADSGQTEQGFKSAKEAAKFIEDQETQKQQQDFTGFKDPRLADAAKELGFTDEQIKAMDPSNFKRYIRQVRSKAATKEQKSAQGDRQKLADDIKKGIRDGTYRLTPGQKKALERGGERQLDRLAYGLAGRDQYEIGNRARRQFYDDTTDLNKYSRSAEGIIRRREMEGSMDDIGIGGAAEQYVRFRESDAAKIKAMRDREAAAETARRERAGAFGSSMSDDELLSMASQRGMSARPGDQVRAFNALKARQQQSISSFGQQMSGLRPDTQERIQAAMRRGLSPGQAAQEELNRRKETDVVALQIAQRKEDEARQKLANTEASYKNKYPGRDMSDQAVQGRIPPMSGGRVLSAAERRKQLEDMSDEELNRQPR